MAYVGNLRQYPLTEVLRLIGDGPRRGRLVVERGGLSAEIYCENGYILHVWRNGNAVPLAQMWLNTGFIGSQQMNQIASITGRDPFTLTDMEFAQVAVDRGVVSTDGVTEWAMNDAVALLSILLGGAMAIIASRTASRRPRRGCAGRSSSPMCWG